MIKYLKKKWAELTCLHRYEIFHVIELDHPPVFTYCLYCPRCKKYKGATMLIH